MAHGCPRSASLESGPGLLLGNNCLSLPGFPKKVRKWILLSLFQVSWLKGGALGGGGKGWSVAPHRRVSGEVACAEEVQGSVGFPQRAGIAPTLSIPYPPFHLSDFSFI